MKALTVGWLIVFIIIGLINLYIFNSYMGLDFQDFKHTKLAVYIGIHLFLSLIALVYFYLFFTGRTQVKYRRILSQVAGFQIAFTSYSAIFYLLYDLAYLLRGRINYPDYLIVFLDRLFYGGFIIFGLAGLVAGLGLYHSKKIDIKTYIVELEAKDSSLKSLDLVYLSDGHINSSVNLSNIGAIVAMVNDLDPDLVLLGGDFFDEGTTVEDKLLASQALAQIKSKYGIFAVEGNHEYKSGNGNINEQMAYLSDQGIIVLQDQVFRNKDFNIIGRKDKDYIKTMDQLVEQTNPRLPTLLLNHKPEYGPALAHSSIGLQLSGHTHNGQYIPVQGLNWIDSLLRDQYIYGSHKQEGLNIIVSSGLGNWAIPIRIGSRREIVDIKLKFR